MKQMWVRESNNTTLDLVDRWILNVPEAPPSICKYQSFTYVCLVIFLFTVGGGFLFRCSFAAAESVVVEQNLALQITNPWFCLRQPLVKHCLERGVQWWIEAASIFLLTNLKPIKPLRYWQKKKPQMYMDAFYSCGKRQRMPAFQSWLTHNPPVIKTANTALSTAAKSVFVGIHSWQALDTNISYRYLSFTTLPETCGGHIFHSPLCLSGNRQQQPQQQPGCLFFANPPQASLFCNGMDATLWRLYFCFVAPPRRWRADWFAGRPFAPSLPPSSHRSRRKAGRKDGGLSECGIRQRINLSLLLTVWDFPCCEVLQRARGCACPEHPRWNTVLTLQKKKIKSGNSQPFEMTSPHVKALTDVKGCNFWWPKMPGKFYGTNQQRMNHTGK